MKRLVSSILSFILLGGIVYGDDYGNTIGTSANIGVNSSVSGRLERSGDIDVFRLRVDRSGSLRVYTTGSTDTYGYLIDSNKRLLGRNDDSNGLNFEINARVSPGVYYIVVKGYGNSTGSYVLHTSMRGDGSSYSPNGGSGSNGDDHGNSILAATNININSSVSGNLDGEGDTDFFRFRISQSGVVNIYTTGSTDTYGSLIDSHGGVVQSDDDSGVNYNFKIVRTLSPGTYYVRVKGYNDSVRGSYRLYVSYQNGGSSGNGSGLQFPVSGSGWSNTSGSPYHRLVNYAGRTFDDTNALDLNLNRPSYNSDRGVIVRPVANGRVIVKYPRLGFVLVEHNTPLRLDNGRVYHTWYSGYMHMSNLTNSDYVTTNTVLGRISRVGTTNDHLHFAIYVLRNDVYTSINVRNNLSSFARHISAWY